MTNEWIELRDGRGRYQGRYHPRTQRLILVERHVETLHELSRYRQPQAERKETYLHEALLVVE